MTETTNHIDDEKNGLLTLIDPLELESQDFIVIDFIDSRTPINITDTEDNHDLLEFCS